VYKVTNTKEKRTYIGATTKSIKERQKDHLQKVDKYDNNKLYDAISTYGVEAFVWETIDTANTVDELAHKEKYYISFFDSKENGYNSDIGGGFKKTVYKYDLKSKELVGAFECLDDAGESVGAIKQQISRACLGVNKVFGGHYWSYDKYGVFEPSKDQRKKTVYQYTLDSTLIACFSSVADASRETGVNKSCIAKVCRGERKSAEGHLWTYN